MDHLWKDIANAWQNLGLQTRTIDDDGMPQILKAQGFQRRKFGHFDIPIGGWYTAVPQLAAAGDL